MLAELVTWMDAQNEGRTALDDAHGQGRVSLIADEL
jgi:hypothetical protein